MLGRKPLKINLVSLARKSGLSQSYLSRVFRIGPCAERDRRTPSVANCQLLATALGLSLDYFVDELNFRRNYTS